MRAITLALSILVLLIACANMRDSVRSSRFNPRNWFGHSRETRQ